MLEVGKRVGLVGGESASSQFDNELATIPKLPVSATSDSFWRVLIRTEGYQPELIPTLTDCFRFVERGKSPVLRGWDFPHLSHLATEVSQGSNWISSWVDFPGQHRMLVFVPEWPVCSLCGNSGGTNRKLAGETCEIRHGPSGPKSTRILGRCSRLFVFYKSGPQNFGDI